MLNKRTEQAYWWYYMQPQHMEGICSHVVDLRSIDVDICSLSMWIFANRPISKLSNAEQANRASLLVALYAATAYGGYLQPRR